MDDKIIYAPWREEFLLSAKREEGCLFCNRIATPADDEKHFIFYRGDTALAMMNLYPYTSGHLLIVPYRHVGEVEETTDAENLEAAQLMQRGVRALKQSMHPDGFTLGLNVGRAAGAGVPGHLHWHVVARWEGDSNFLPVVGGARLLSVRVEESYRLIKQALVAPGRAEGGPDMYRKISDFLAEWDEQSNASRKIFAAMTDASLTQSVAAGHRTLGRIAWHIVCTIPEMAGEVGLSFAGPDAKAPLPDNAQAIREGYDAAAGGLAQAIKESWSDETLEITDELYGERWQRGKTLSAVVLHEVQHRGQMLVLLRQAGIKVPGVFGPALEEWTTYGMPVPEI